MGEEGTTTKEEEEAKARAQAQEKIDEALSCSCIDDLKEGPCGAPFVEAFGCFVKSQQPVFEVSCRPTFPCSRQKV